MPDWNLLCPQRIIADHNNNADFVYNFCVNDVLTKPSHRKVMCTLSDNKSIIKIDYDLVNGTRSPYNLK